MKNLDVHEIFSILKVQFNIFENKDKFLAS